MHAISKPAAEDRTVQISATGVIADGPVEVSAMTLAAGSGAAATAVLNDSEDGGGTDKWKLAAVSGGDAHISFPKPIPFSIGLYGTLGGAGAILSVALTNS